MDDPRRSRRLRVAVRWRLIKPFIRGIKLGQHDNQHLHLTDGPVTDTGTNHDTGPRMHIEDFVIELHLSILAAFQEVISFCQFLVIVKPGILGDICHVNGAREIGDVRKRAPRCAARAVNTGHPREVNDLISASGLGGHTLRLDNG